MARFPFNDSLAFAPMLAVARWGDALPLALLRIAQWALALISTLVVCAATTAGLRLGERRGAVPGFVLAVQPRLPVVKHARGWPAWSRGAWCLGAAARGAR